MSKVIVGAAAAIALAAFAGAAQAADVCIWTGVDWACGDGNVVSRHYPASTGPNMLIRPVQTQVNPALPPGPSPTPPGRFDPWNPN